MTAKNRGHKLITKTIEKALLKSPLYTWDGRSKEAPILVKFFSAGATWYITEAEPIPGGGWTFYGLHVNEATGDRELGYSDFDELNDCPHPSLPGLPAVERDRYFGEHKLGEFLEPEPELTQEERDFNGFRAPVDLPDDLPQIASILLDLCRTGQIEEAAFVINDCPTPGVAICLVLMLVPHLGPVESEKLFAALNPEAKPPMDLSLS